MVMCRLDALDEESLVELASEAWAGRAPSRRSRSIPSSGTDLGHTVRAWRPGTTWRGSAWPCRRPPRAPRGAAARWRVRDKGFVWERPLGKKDVAELGDAAPAGPVVAAYVPDEGAKLALIAEEPDVYFTTRTSTATPPCCAGWTRSTCRR